MKFFCIIPHERRGYIHPFGNFKEFYPWPVTYEENRHSVIWYHEFETTSEAEAIQLMQKEHDQMKRLFLRYAYSRDSYFKSYAMVLHDVENDRSIDGDWIPEYSKGNAGYLFDRTQCSNALLEEWELLRR